jgi:hypothetical protein
VPGAVLGRCLRTRVDEASHLRAGRRVEEVQRLVNGAAGCLAPGLAAAGLVIEHDDLPSQVNAAECPIVTPGTVTEYMNFGSSSEPVESPDQGSFWAA